VDEHHVSPDDSPAMASIGCADEKTSPYPGYDVAAVGGNVCVYRAHDARSGKAPIVRFLSFLYDLNRGASALRAMKADHDLLARTLAKDTGVVLDIHENHGGYNPFIFLSWFAHAPWGHERVHVRVAPGFSDDDVRSFLFDNDANVAAYKAALAQGESEMSYPFLCTKDCDSAGPRPAELVTRAPVAVITGPECVSSCDAISALWSSFHLGPIVGKQPMHAFTTVRHSIPVAGPDNRDLGLFRIGLSWEGFAGKEALEGHAIPLDWEAPETFEGRESWVAESVVNAERLLRGKK
jgi:hypothetical protein